MDALLQQLVSGLLTGGVLALLAAGLAVIFGVMGMVNFAHGDFVMLGMYGALLVGGILAVPVAGAAFILLPVFLVFGWGVHRLVVDPVLRSRLGGSSHGGHDAQLLLTLGISLILQNAALMLFGADPRGGSNSGSSLDLLGIVIDPQRLIAGSIGVALSAMLFVVLRSTRFGRSLRAASADPVAAEYSGIDIRAVQRSAFAIGTGMAGVGGALLAGFYPTQPFVANDFIILMFAAVVLGGLGSVLGACIGGLIIGVVLGVSQLFLPLQLQTLAVFAVFLLVLYVRPQGILGQKVRV